MRSRTKTVITLETWQRTTVRIGRETIPVEELSVRDGGRDSNQSAAPGDHKILTDLIPAKDEKHE